MTSSMQSPVGDLISADDVEAVTHEVLNGLLGDFPPSAEMPAEMATALVAATIEILGDSPVELTISAAFNTLHTVALGWFGDDLGDDILAAVEDATHELCNVVGGALKTLLDGDYTLGIPVTTRVGDSPRGMGVVVQSPIGAVDVNVVFVGRELIRGAVS